MCNVIAAIYLDLSFSLSVRASLKINRKSKESVSKGWISGKIIRSPAGVVSRLGRDSVSFVDLL